MGDEYCLTMPPSCKDCFPHSRCGSAELYDRSGVLVENSACGPSLAAECALAGDCFDHGSGFCNFDGEIEYTICKAAEFCAPCFPNSRCASGGGSGSADDNSGSSDDATMAASSDDESAAVASFLSHGIALAVVAVTAAVASAL